MPTTIRKKEGFKGQKAIIVPRPILSKACAKSDILNTLYITDIGYYPKAKYHYRERPQGTDQHILVYCHEGSGHLTINNEDSAIKAGEFFVIPSKVPHVYKADEKSPWSIYWLHFKGKVSSSILSFLEKRQGGFKGVMPYGEDSLALFNEMYTEMEKGYGNDHLIYANMCLWHYLTRFIFTDKYNTNSKTTTKDSSDMAIEFMQTHIDQELTLEAIAKAVHLSSSHFSFLFREKTGFSPIDYFNHLKVQKACQYLLFTDMRVREIAQELGVFDPYYFSRMFKKVMGMPPNEYREKRVH